MFFHTKGKTFYTKHAPVSIAATKPRYTFIQSGCSSLDRVGGEIIKPAPAIS